MCCTFISFSFFLYYICICSCYWLIDLFVLVYFQLDNYFQDSDLKDQYINCSVEFIRYPSFHSHVYISYISFDQEMQINGWKRIHYLKEVLPNSLSFMIDTVILRRHFVYCVNVCLCVFIWFIFRIHVL